MTSRPTRIRSCADPSSCRSAGFTLVELLVVITIIAMIIALLIPAVQAARESARCAQCISNLHELAAGVLQHVEKHDQYPTGGWGWHWVGDPDRGFKRDQPGGWFYNILPYIDQKDVYAWPDDNDRDTLTAHQLTRANELIRTPLKIANCPSRRRTVSYPKPAHGDTCQGKGPCWAAYNAAENDPATNVAARTDYAINAGSQPCNGVIPGPGSLSEGDNWLPCDKYDSSYAGDVCVKRGSCLGECWPTMLAHDGLSYQRSEVRPTLVRDGDMCTIMLGEKCLMPEHYYNGEDLGDNENMFTGYNHDVFRCTAYVPQLDRSGGDEDVLWRRFGSAHLSGCHFAFCDGRVKKLRFNIDAETFRHLGSRDGGVPVDMMQF